MKLRPPLSRASPPPLKKVLVGLSGGKDSLSLLCCLSHLRRKAPVSFELACATVDPQTPEFDPSPLKAWLASLDVPAWGKVAPTAAAPAPAAPVEPAVTAPVPGAAAQAKVDAAKQAWLAKLDNGSWGQ